MKSTEKQVSLKSPEVTGITHQVVTVTKQAKPSEDSSSDDNSKQESTGSDSNCSSVNQVGTTINLSNMADPHLDKQLNHVLEKFLLANGANHEIRQMFKECNVYQFEDFIGCDMQALTEMKRKQHILTVGFVHWKRTQIYNVILYYKFQ